MVRLPSLILQFKKILYLVVFTNFLLVKNYLLFSFSTDLLGQKKNTNFQCFNFFSNIENYDIMFNNNINFITLLLVIIVSIGFVFFLLLQANLLNLSLYPNSTFDAEKYSPYECGFSPFWTERTQFDIKFYLVALLFLVFDVELMFLLPYCISYFYLGFYSYLIFIIFFALLIVGFLVEWAVGMLTWKGEEGFELYSNNHQFKSQQISVDLFSNSKFFRYLRTYITCQDRMAYLWITLDQLTVPTLYFVWEHYEVEPINSMSGYNIEKTPYFKIDNMRDYKEVPYKYLFVKDEDPLIFLTWLKNPATAKMFIKFRDGKLFFAYPKQEIQDRIERFFANDWDPNYWKWLNTLPFPRWNMSF